MSEIGDLNRQVVDLCQQGRFDEALAPALRFRDLAEQTLSEQDPFVSTALNVLGAVHHELGHHAEARSILERALDLRRRATSSTHPSLVPILNNLVACCHAAGDREATSFFYRLAKKLEAIQLPPGDPQRMKLLGMLARAAATDGDLEEAERLFVTLFEEQRLRPEIEEEALLLSTELNEYARLVCEPRGDYGTGEAALRRAIDLLAQHGHEHARGAAASWNNLASIQHSRNDLDAALASYQKALNISLAADDADRRAIGRTQNNLAGLLRRKGQRADALTLYLGALANARSVGDKENERNVQNNLGGVLRELGQHESAIQSYEEALRIDQELNPTGKFSRASLLNNLATAADELGDLERALVEYGAAMALYRELGTPPRPEVLTCLVNLAGVEAGLGRIDDSLASHDEALRIEEYLLGLTLVTSSDRQRLALLESVPRIFHPYLTLVLAERREDAARVRGAFEATLRRKALAVELAAVVREEAVIGRHPEARATFEELSAVTSEIAKGYLDDPGAEPIDAFRERLAALERHREALEIKLAHQIDEVQLDAIFRRADTEAILRALPPNSALVEMLRLEPFRFGAATARGEPLCDPPRYIAFVVRAGDPNPHILDLGPAEEIEKHLVVVRGVYIERARDFAPPEAPTSGSTEAAIALRRRIFDPIAEVLGDERRIFLSPDGQLLWLPFEILPFEDGYLVDRYSFSYLGVGRDLLRMSVPPRAAAAPPLVIADPDYDVGDRATSKLHFPRLPGTRDEGIAIAKLLGVKPLLGPEATETTVKQCQSPAILHLATHGYFLETAARQDTGNELAPRDRPLLRTGLALAGANRGGIPGDPDDGLLTAEDVTAMDLSGTRLVILSACDTGLGTVREGEGVFGLRRAFVLAGARTSILSLWKVPDAETALLMRHLYELLFEPHPAETGPRPTVDALHEAQQRMRKTHPSVGTWGAFICLGDPGPVDWRPASVPAPR